MTDRTYIGKNGQVVTLQDILDDDSLDLSKPRFRRSADSDAAIYLEILKDKLDDIESYGVVLSEIDPVELRRCLYEQVDREVNAINTTMRKENNIGRFKMMDGQFLAYLLARIFTVKNIDLNAKADRTDADDYDEKTTQFGIYDEEKGIYEIRAKRIGQIAAMYEPAVSFNKQTKKSIYYESVIDNFECYIKDGLVEVTHLEKNPYLIPFMNGIFDFEHKVLLPFDPSHVFISRYYVNYVPNATHPTCTLDDGTPWIFEDWISDLFNGDSDDVNSLMYILCSTFMPRLPLDTYYMFYSEWGSSGKGTLMAMIESIVGASATATMSMSNFDDRFALSQLLVKKVVVCNENNVGEFIDKSANLKAITSNDSVYVDRKNKDPLSLVFWVRIFQCINSLPTIRDNTGSFLRRMLILEFPNHYEGDKKKPEIKNDILQRQEVKEYIVSQLMQLPVFKSIPRSAHSKSLLDDFHVDNDIVYRFYKEVLCDESVCPWYVSQLPFCVLYPIFYGWCKNIVHLSDQHIKKDRKFKQELINTIRSDTERSWNMKKSTLNTTTENYRTALDDWQKDERYRNLFVDCGLSPRDPKNGSISYAMQEQASQLRVMRTSARDYIERKGSSMIHMDKKNNINNKIWIDDSGNHEPMVRYLWCWKDGHEVA